MKVFALLFVLVGLALAAERKPYDGYQVRITGSTVNARRLRVIVATSGRRTFTFACNEGEELCSAPLVGARYEVFSYSPGSVYACDEYGLSPNEPKNNTVVAGCLMEVR